MSDEEEPSILERSRDHSTSFLTTLTIWERRLPAMAKYILHFVCGEAY